MQTTPFKRAIIMMQAIATALSAGMAPMAAAASVGEYQSRGKGLGRRSGSIKWGRSPSGKYARTFNGRQECERRKRQIERGIIAVSA